MLTTKIALIDDSEFFLQLVGNQLALRQLDVRCYPGIDNFLADFFSTDWRPELYIIDYDLGDDRMTGLDVMAILQERYPAPMIMLTGTPLENRNNLRLRSYYAGAVNFLTKPCDINELHAIIYNLTALKSPRSLDVELQKFTQKSTQSVLSIDDDCRYEVFSRTVICNGNFTIKLTEKESSLLEILLKNKNSLVERDRVYQHIYGHEMHPLNRSIDNLACRLRTKLSEVCNDVVIENHRSLGYRLYNH